MKISVIQTNGGADRTANFTQARDLIDDAVKADRPDMIVLPETFAVIGGSPALRRELAEPLPKTGAPGGAAYEFLAMAARDHGVFVHGGSFMERDGTDFFGTSVAFGRDGTELARYRKIHRFDVTTPDGTQYRESDIIEAGKDIVTYQADGLTIGCTICYDLRFAELYRALSEAGADIIMVPSAFTLQTGKDHWEILLRARAIESQTYIVAAAQIGTHMEGDKKRTTWGHSMIVDPWGRVLAQAQDTVGFASATVDMDYLKSVRKRIPVGEHRVL